MLVARTLALVDQPPAKPPHQWVKFEAGFDQHVERAGEIVTAADMRQLVRHDRRELRLGQMTLEACGPAMMRRTSSITGPGVARAEGTVRISGCSAETQE